MTHRYPFHEDVFSRREELLSPAIGEITQAMRRYAGLTGRDALVDLMRCRTPKGAPNVAGLNEAELEAHMARSIHRVFSHPELLCDTLEDPEHLYNCALALWPWASDASLTRAIQVAAEIFNAEIEEVRAMCGLEPFTPDSKEP